MEHFNDFTQCVIFKQFCLFFFLLIFRGKEIRAEAVGAE